MGSAVELSSARLVAARPAIRSVRCRASPSRRRHRRHLPSIACARAHRYACERALFFRGEAPWTTENLSRALANACQSLAHPTTPMGPMLHEIRDTDMGAAITYLLLDLEGVDTEPDILDDGKKGPWTIFATADCAEQFKAKYGDNIVLTFSEIPIEFTITYGEIQTKKGGSSNEQSNARALASALNLKHFLKHTKSDREPPRPPRNVGQPNK
eukprot:scaffold5174_cov118-Isochrysis_galbana.AAC.4